ncbi:MAG: hypothetical protein ACYT04_36210 [Nostoc sp.]
MTSPKGLTDALEETYAAGQLRRLECAWAIEQVINRYEFNSFGDQITQISFCVFNLYIY